MAAKGKGAFEINDQGFDPTNDSQKITEGQKEPNFNDMGHMIIMREAKSKRTNVLIRPSIYKRAMEKCNKENKATSFNDLVNILLEEYADEE